MKKIFLKMHPSGDCFGLIELSEGNIEKLKRARDKFYGNKEDDIKPRWVALDIGNVSLMRDEGFDEENDDFEKMGFVVVEDKEDNGLLFVNGQEEPFVEFGYDFDCDVDFIEFNDSRFWIKINVEESRGDFEYYSATVPWHILDML